MTTLDAWIELLVRSETEPEAMDRWVDRVMGEIHGEVVEVREDPVLSGLVRTAARSHWLSFLNLLGQAPHEFRLVSEAEEVALTVAQRRHPVTVVIRIYTAAQQEVWRHVTEVVEEIRAGREDATAALVYFWTRAGAWFDEAIQASVQIHETETDRIRQGDAARLLDAVRALLRSEVGDPRTASASLGGHPVSGINTALLLHTDDDAVVADLPGAAVRLVAEMGLRRPLLVHPGGRDLWVWVASREAPDLRQLAGAEHWLTAQRVCAAVGAPAAGLDGFVQSHRDALAAQRIALSRATPAPLTLFDDVELLSMLAHLDTLPRFVSRTLGGLAEPGENAERLRETVHTLLVSGSVEAAARTLLVHKNTVRYRVERAEELLGRPVSSAPTELELALRCFALWGSGPLTT